MKVVVYKSPKLLSCILRMIFKIKKEESSSSGVRRIKAVLIHE